MIMLMNVPAKRVMSFSGKGYNVFCVDFSSGRYATMTMMENGCPFAANVTTNNKVHTFNVQSDFFKAFIKELAEFFKSPSNRVEHR
jgi:hypothetical protein